MKKNLFYLALSSLLLCLLPQRIGAVVCQSTVQVNQETEFGKDVTSFRKKKLSFKEKIVFYVLKKKSEKMLKQKKSSSNSGKSQIVAFLLCLFLGYLGIHRFYLGYTGMGVLELLTVGIFGIGWLVDFILLIIPNGLTPKDGSY
jgi:TM2 domain